MYQWVQIATPYKDENGQAQTRYAYVQQWADVVKNST